ncbi:MAG: haloacid dehalogenase-like hydrolase, partial [Anaerovibrio sp.]|nr:haloacid dehalogenase-like hydrolase [Anaerovibrio sp.]
YLPMVEVITYLQNNGFNFYVVTGTDRQLVRQALKAPIPSINADHVIGTDSLPVMERQGWAGSQYFLFNEDGAKDKVMRGPFQFTDNKAGKVQNIAKEIGIQPVIALGNSTSDGSMLNYALANPKYKSFAMGVCCDDSVRDWGTQAKGDKFKAFCEKYGITPISMAKDWKTIYGYNVTKTPTRDFDTAKDFKK